MKHCLVGAILLMIFSFFPSAISQPPPAPPPSYTFIENLNEGDCVNWRFSGGIFHRIPVACSAVLPGTSVTMGGSMITSGNCISNTTTVPGATIAMVALASPVIYPGDSVLWKSYVSAPNTVTVKLCAFKTTTPLTSTYNVRVNQ